MIVIKNRDVNLKDTLESGQCFRVTKENNNSYTMIIFDRVVNIQQKGDNLFVKSNKEKNLKEIIINYLDLNNNYTKENNELISKDKIIRKYVEKSKGLKILNQSPFETLISYIISSNNNVSRISKAVNNISKSYGEKITFESKNYYLFPALKRLKNIKLEDLRKFKLGYRDKYIIDAINKLKSKEIQLDKINNMKTEDALNYLRKIKGIGIKVASCILLFSYHRFDVYPIDTWVIKTIKKEYNLTNININSITKFTKEKFGKNSGLSIQYMYHVSRNKEENNE